MTHGDQSDRSDQAPQEQPAVRTTIVGGRPPGSGKGIGPIPRGIEVLVKKASVDPDFRTRLLEGRDAAADDIGLGLTDAERAILTATPRTQLEIIIDHTHVAPEHKPAFLGKVAAGMMLALGIAVGGCDDPAPAGIRPDDLPDTQPTQPAGVVDIPDGGSITITGIEPLGTVPDDSDTPATSKPTTKPATTLPVPPSPVSRGVRPDRPTKGLRPDRVPPPSAGDRPDAPQRPDVSPDSEPSAED